jgi:transcriptional regulator with XRE-family HTH domain
MKQIKLPEILKNLRLSSKLSQAELAKRLGITQPNISDWENGVSRPEYESLWLLADIFDVTLDELLGRK